MEYFIAKLLNNDIISSFLVSTNEYASFADPASLYMIHLIAFHSQIMTYLIIVFTVMCVFLLNLFTPLMQQHLSRRSLYTAVLNHYYLLPLKSIGIFSLYKCIALIDSFILTYFDKDPLQRQGLFFKVYRSLFGLVVTDDYNSSHRTYGVIASVARVHKGYDDNLIMYLMKDCSEWNLDLADIEECLVQKQAGSIIDIVGMSRGYYWSRNVYSAKDYIRTSFIGTVNDPSNIKPVLGIADGNYTENVRLISPRISLLAQKHLAQVSQFLHSKKLEWFFFGWPLLIVLKIIIPSIALLEETDTEEIEPGVLVKVVGSQWYWSYESLESMNVKDLSYTQYLVREPMNDLLAYVDSRENPYTPLEMAKSLKEDRFHFHNMDFVLDVLNTGKINYSDYIKERLFILEWAGARNEYVYDWANKFQVEYAKRLSRVVENSINPFNEGSEEPCHVKEQLAHVLKRLVEIDQQNRLKKGHTFLDSTIKAQGMDLYFNPDSVKSLDRINVVINLILTVWQKNTNNIEEIRTEELLKWLFSAEYLRRWDFINFDVDDDLNVIVTIREALLAFLPINLLFKLTEGSTFSFYEGGYTMHMNENNDLRIVMTKDFMKKHHYGAKALEEGVTLGTLPNTSDFHISAMIDYAERMRRGTGCNQRPRDMDTDRWVLEGNVGAACSMLQRVMEDYKMGENDFNSVVDTIRSVFFINHKDGPFSFLRNNLLKKSPYDDDWIYKRDMNIASSAVDENSLLNRSLERIVDTDKFNSFNREYLINALSISGITSTLSRWAYGVVNEERSREFIISNPRLLSATNTLVIPTNVFIKFLVTSTDVLHSWAVPNMGIKMDAAPGRLNAVMAYATAPGEFVGQCSELCGPSHYAMPINVRAVSPDEYRKYIAIVRGGSL